MTTLRAAITQARPAARFVGGVVLEVSLGGGPAADRAGAGGVPDLGQVPELDPGVVAFGFVLVVAGVGGDRVDGDDQVRAVSRGGQPPGSVPAGRPVPAGRGEGEPGLSRRAGACAVPLVLGFGPGAAVGDGVPLVVGDGQAPRGLRVRRGGGGQVAGQPRVDRAEAAELAGPVRQAGQGGQRDGQRDPPGEPGRGRPRWPRPPGEAPSGGDGSLCPGAGPGRRGRGAGPCRPPAPPCAAPSPGR